MKSPSKDQVEVILRRKKTNDKIDLAVATGKRHHQPEIDVSLLDEVFRPYCHLLEAAQSQNDDADEVMDAVASCLANMGVELITRLVDRDSPKDAFDFAQLMANKFAEMIGQGILMNYGGQKQR